MRGRGHAMTGRAAAWVQGGPGGHADRHAAEPIGEVEAIYAGALAPDLAVSTFRNAHRLFPTRRVRVGAAPRPLPVSNLRLGPVEMEIGGQSRDLDAILALDDVAGLIVLKDGAVVHEAYRLGNGPATRWMSMSVAKSITATLLGAAIEDGHVGGLDDMVTDYIPTLSGSAYAGVSIKDILLMASGVAWNETYTDPASNRRDLLRAQIAQRSGGLLAVMAALPRAAAPGTRHTYSTGETQVLGEVVRAATGRSLAAYLSEKIWAPYGMEADAEWWLESEDGGEVGGSGLSATLRDYARFGQFILDGGMIGDLPVLPEGWTETAGRRQRLRTGKEIDYGYMWWPAWTAASIGDGAYAAVGICGQYIYINPARRVVVAMNCARTAPTGQEPIETMSVIDALVAAIH